MADGVEITAGAGTTVATDDVGGFQYQRVKAVWGADGSVNDTSAAKPLPVNCPNTYERVLSGATAVLGAGSGATGDYIAGVLVIPATISPGGVTLIDSGTSIPIFAGGASSLSNLVPFYIPLGMVSQNGAWSLTAGSNVSCIAMGVFT